MNVADSELCVFYSRVYRLGTLPSNDIRHSIVRNFDFSVNKYFSKISPLLCSRVDS